MLNGYKIFWLFVIVEKKWNAEKNENTKQKRYFKNNGFYDFAGGMLYKCFPTFEKMQEFRENMKIYANCEVTTLFLTDKQFGQIKTEYGK